MKVQIAQKDRRWNCKFMVCLSGEQNGSNFSVSHVWLKHRMKSVEHYGLEPHARFYTGHHFESC